MNESIWESNCGNYIDRSTDTRQLVERVITEQGSRYKAYAYVCSQAVGPGPLEDWIEAKHLLEKIITADVMEEHGWRQEPDGSWIQCWDSER